jgi:hypothetical protein
MRTVMANHETGKRNIHDWLNLINTEWEQLWPIMRQERETFTTDLIWSTCPRMRTVMADHETGKRNIHDWLNLINMSQNENSYGKSWDRKEKITRQERETFTTDLLWSKCPRIGIEGLGKITPAISKAIVQQHFEFKSEPLEIKRSVLYVYHTRWKPCIHIVMG